MADELLGVVEIAELLQVGRRTAARYADRDDFPQPAEQLRRGRLWRRSDVEAWQRANLPFRVGRPRLDT